MPETFQIGDHVRCRATPFHSAGMGGVVVAVDDRESGPTKQVVTVKADHLTKITLAKGSAEHFVNSPPRPKGTVDYWCEQLELVERPGEVTSS